MAVPRGIEPLFRGWKPRVLTDRRRDRISAFYCKILSLSSVIRLHSLNYYSAILWILLMVWIKQHLFQKSLFPLWFLDFCQFLNFLILLKMFQTLIFLQIFFYVNLKLLWKKILQLDFLWFFLHKFKNIIEKNSSTKFSVICFENPTCIYIKFTRSFFVKLILIN